MIEWIKTKWRWVVTGFVGVLLLASTILNTRRNRAIRESDKAVARANRSRGQQIELQNQRSDLDREFVELQELESTYTDEAPLIEGDLADEWRKELRK